VTKVEPYKLGQYALVGNPGDPGVIVTVTIKNGTDVVFDTSLADVLVTYGPNGEATEREYDEEGFAGNIPPGTSRREGPPQPSTTSPSYPPSTRMSY
jgi:hypothetical protein